MVEHKHNFRKQAEGYLCECGAELMDTRRQMVAERLEKAEAFEVRSVHRFGTQFVFTWKFRYVADLYVSGDDPNPICVGEASHWFDLARPVDALYVESNKEAEEYDYRKRIAPPYYRKED